MREGKLLKWAGLLWEQMFNSHFPSFKASDYWLSSFFFTFNVGTLIITLSYGEIAILARFSVKSHFFYTFEEEKCKILFWANSLHTYVESFAFCYILLMVNGKISFRHVKQ